MSHEVHCIKLDKTLPGLDFQPYPGEMGKRIYEQVSAEAWQLWLAHQTMVINENRLNLLDASTRAFLEQEMQKFFFSGEEIEKPAGYTPQEES